MHRIRASLGSAWQGLARCLAQPNRPMLQTTVMTTADQGGTALGKCFRGRMGNVRVGRSKTLTPDLCLVPHLEETKRDGSRALSIKYLLFI